MDTRELLNEIRKTYGRDIFTLQELYEILYRCDFTRTEAREVLRESLNSKQLGRISVRAVRRNMPARSSFVAVLADIVNNNDLTTK